MQKLTYEDIQSLKPRLTEEEYLELIYFNYPSIWMEENLCNPQFPEKKLELRHYQNKVINDLSKRKIFRWGRQIGKSLTLQLLILYYGLKVPNSKILVIGPQKTHVEQIFDEIEQLVSYAPHLKSLITTKKQPMQIVFKCGKGTNKAMFFTTGEESGGKGLSIRGKCQPAGVKIHMADGGLKNIEDIQKGDIVLSFDETSAKIVHNPVIDLIDNGSKDIFKLTTRTGISTKVTDNHPFYHVSGEWRDMSMLNVGDYIAIPTKGQFGNHHETIDIIKYIAYMTGDGNCATSETSTKYCSKITNIRFSVDNKRIQEDFIKTLGNLGINHGVVDDKRTKTLKSINISTKGYNSGNCIAYNILERFGLNRKYSYEKHIHEQLMKMDKNNTTLLLNRLFSTDGWGSISKRGSCEIGYCSSSEHLINDVHFLLSKFGIISRIRRKKTTHRDTFILTIRDKINMLKFLDNIGSIYGKEDICNKIRSILSSSKSEDSMGIPTEVINGEIVRLGIPIKGKFPQLYNSRIVNKEIANTINAYLNSDIITKYIQGDIIFDRIKSINKQEKEHTYGLTIENNHTYIVDGFISHNTANVLIVDEADYINDDVMEQVVIPTTNSYTEPVIILSSTPTGRRGFFRKTWEGGHYSTYHYTSAESPSWNKEKEEMIKSGITKRAYTLEYMAQWGDAEEGVFSKTDMNLCEEMSKLTIMSKDHPEGYIRQYSTNDDHTLLSELIKPKTRILGVDWNKAKNGVRLVWVDFDSNHNIWMRHKWKIDAQDFTQNVAMSKIIELHASLKFDYIMVDVGFGSLQIEDLHLHGLKHPQTRLDKVVIGVPTDSQMEIADIATGEIRKTYVKNFIVESTVRFMEQHRIRVPIEENRTTAKSTKEKNTILDQMNEYTIDKYTANGRPVYKAGKAGDHDLDAYMFALYGYLTQVIKTNKLWDKIPKTVPKTISYDKILAKRSGTENNKKEIDLAKTTQDGRITYKQQPQSNWSRKLISSRPTSIIGRGINRSGHNINRAISR